MVDTPAAVFFDLPLPAWATAELIAAEDNGDSASVTVRLSGRPHREMCTSCGKATVALSDSQPLYCGHCGTAYGA